MVILPPVDGVPKERSRLIGAEKGIKLYNVYIISLLGINLMTI